MYTCEHAHSRVLKAFSSPFHLCTRILSSSVCGSTCICMHVYYVNLHKCNNTRIYSTTRIPVLDPAQRAWSCTSVAVGADAVLVRTSGNSVRCHTSNRTVVVVVVVSVVFARHKPLIFTTKACARAVFTSLIRSSCCCNILQFTGSPPHINATHIRHHRTTFGQQSDIKARVYQHPIPKHTARPGFSLRLLAIAIGSV